MGNRSRQIESITEVVPPLAPALRAAVDAAVAAHRGRAGALLPILHAVQDALGHVPAGAVAPIAQALNLTRAEVHGVISFYHDFRAAPAGRHVVRLCRAEACQSMGASALEAHARRRLGIDMHGTTADGEFTLEPVYCLGNCALSPAAMIDGALHGRVTPQRLDALLADCHSDPGLDPGEESASDATRNSRSLTAFGMTASFVGAASAAADDASGPKPLPHVTVYVPRDAAALSVGADAVAQAITHEAQRRGRAIRLVRNGSRGALWLEPLVEIATPSGRIAYGPVSAGDVATLFDAGLFDAGLLEGGTHALRLGPADDIPWLKRQQRLTFARVGVTDPLDPADYRAHGGWHGLRKALEMAPADIVREVIDSGLRGRGGAAFPAGIKWKTALEAPAYESRITNPESPPSKYIVCNADEGDSGTFADRMLMEGDPFCLIEGMAIAGLAVGATHGFIYLRSEYPHAWRTLDAAIRIAYRHGFLGADVCGSGRRFELEARLGAGAYICGEETSLLESLEGRRGQVRFKPPLPAVKGLFGQPTVVNNVITFASVPFILAEGAQAYRDCGIGRSRGTVPLQLAGNIARGGLFEIAFGPTLRELLYDVGGGSRSGRPIRAVQVGGPLGAYIPASQFDTPVDYEAFAAIGGMLGHGGVVAFDDTVDMAQQARFAMEFCAIESCGKCTPCRIGSVRGVEVIDRLLAGQQPERQEVLLRDLCETMLHGSLCALGGMAPFPVLSALDHFHEDFEPRQSAAAR